MNYSSYLASGEFYQVFGGSPPSPVELGDASGFVVGEYLGDSYYFDFGAGQATEKLSLSLVPDNSSIAADGTDAATIANIPQGVTVSLNGADPVPVTDGEIKFKTLDAGDHSLVFSGIKYLPQELTIGAV